MYQDGYGWKHSVIVDQLGSNPCNTSNIFVAAHDDDFYRRPLSYYAGYQLYPIEMKGYFDEYHVAFLPIAFTGSGSLNGNANQNSSSETEDTGLPTTAPYNAYPPP